MLACFTTIPRSLCKTIPACRRAFTASTNMLFARLPVLGRPALGAAIAQRISPAWLVAAPLSNSACVSGPAGSSGGAAASVRPGQGVACRAYADPEVYDVAFNFRKYEQEVAHLLALHQRHCSGALQRVLEVACGPARHAVLLTQVAGVQATCLDLSPGMLSYARQQAEAAGAAGSMQFVQADMTQGGWRAGRGCPAGRTASQHTEPAAAVPPCWAAEGWAQQVGPPADLAVILLGSLAHCLDNGAALRCFGELARAVRPGGLLVLELPHPSDLWGGY